MALATHTPATWTDILSTTMHNYRKTLTDNIWNSRPLLNYYMSNGRLRTVNGGINIVEPVIYTEGDFAAYERMGPDHGHPQGDGHGSPVRLEAAGSHHRHLRPRRSSEQRQGADGQPSRSQDHAGRDDPQDQAERDALRHLRWRGRSQRFHRPQRPSSTQPAPSVASTAPSRPGGQPRKIPGRPRPLRSWSPSCGPSTTRRRTLATIAWMRSSPTPTVSSSTSPR